MRMLKANRRACTGCGAIERFMVLEEACCEYDI